MQEEKQLPFSEVLTALLQNEQVPIHLLFRLSDMAPDEERRFLAAWPDVDGERRREIVGHLADLAEENFVVDFTPVFKLGLADELASVREAALEGLWDSTDARLVPRLLTLVQTDEDQAVRAAAARALAHFVLLAEWGQVPRSPVAPVVGVLLAAYEAEETAVPLKRAALEALGAANHPRVATFISEAYESDDPDMQLSAIFAMGNTADPRWLPTILSELESASPAMRAEAAHAAGAMGRSDAIPRLAELTTDEDEDVCAAAIVALGQIGGDQAQAILTDLLDDPEYEEVAELIQESLESLLLLGGELELMDYLGEEVDDGDEDEDYLLDYP